LFSHFVLNFSVYYMCIEESHAHYVEEHTILAFHKFLLLQETCKLLIMTPHFQFLCILTSLQLPFAHCHVSFVSSLLLVFFSVC